MASAIQVALATDGHEDGRVFPRAVQKVNLRDTMMSIILLGGHHPYIHTPQHSERFFIAQQIPTLKP